MERGIWTDERIDDMVATNDRRFEELLTRMDRLEMRIDDLQRQLLNFAIVQFAALFTILVTLILRT